MNKPLRALTRIEQGLQVISLIGVIMLVGYLKMTNFQQDHQVPKSNLSLSVQSSILG